VDFIRTTPEQSRLEAIVEAIFEAGARILQRHGVAASNTNAVPALAGVSVGTLYQYFANKDAILIAMARSEPGEALAGVVSGPRSKRGAPDVEPARATVRAALKAMNWSRWRKPIVARLLLSLAAFDKLRFLLYMSPYGDNILKPDPRLRSDAGAHPGGGRRADHARRARRRRRQRIGARGRLRQGADLPLFR
jgi:AcrR family transcriptional regulator